MVLNFSIQPMQNSEVEFCVGGIGLLAVSQKLRVGFSNLLELARRVLNRNPSYQQSVTLTAKNLSNSILY